VLTKALLPVACAALALAACATTPQPPTPPLAKAQRPAIGCVPDTATRLPMKGSECAGFGVRFTDQQLSSTGQPYAEQELRALETSVMTGGVR
jgi:hypothetical protein